MPSLRDKLFHRKGKVPEPSNTRTKSDFHGATLPRVNAVYYPNWRAYRQQPPSSLSLSFITHIYYAFVWVQPDGTVYLSDEFADTQLSLNGVHGALSDLKRVKSQHPNIKALISVGGGNKGSDNFASVAANPQKVGRFTSSLKELIEMHELDGVDVDWEHPKTPGQGQSYNNLLSALRTALPDHLLTSALPCGEWVLSNINLAQSCKSLDYINLMCYDFAGPWTDQCGHQSQLFSPKKAHNEASKISCNSAVHYLLSHGVPSGQILLGVPAYGRSFLGAKKVGDHYKGGAGEDGVFEYRDLPRWKAITGFDDQCGATYSVGGDAGFVSYDDPRSVSLKADFVRKNGLGGLFYWTGAGDTHDERSLVATGWRALNNGEG